MKMQSSFAESGQIAEQAAPVVSGASWEEAADKICAAVEKRAKTTARTASESIYEQIMRDTQDYLRSNVDFNLSSELSMLRNRSQRVHALNEALVKALENVQRLIAEGALTGFNPLDGNWADRLFHSQQQTSRALAAAREAQP